MSLNGIDISKWQKGLDLSKVKCDFVVVKATEGIGYVDSECDKFYQQAKKLGKLLGFYHFARPTNDPIKEAQFFFKNTKNYFHEAIPVLDWEPTTGKGNTAWCKRWLDEVYRLSGVRPMIYMSESVVNAYNWSDVVAGNYGLWVAKYRDNVIDKNYDMSNAGNKPSVKWWAFYAMWQWTSSGRLDGYSANIDCDVFYGDKTAWQKYAGSYKESEKSPELFYAEYVGRRINRGTGWDDSAFGYQCVAGFKVCCEWLGIPVKLTPNNNAGGYWTCKNSNGSVNTDVQNWQNKYFDKVSVKDVKNGDWVIWQYGSKSHPKSHIAMYYLGKEFGQNQGGNGAFCLKSTDFSDASGALRPKAWTSQEAQKQPNPLDSYTDEELAEKVMNGDYGSGDARKKALGDRYDKVQAIVDREWPKRQSRYAPVLPFTQANTNQIANAHRYDFDWSNFNEYMKKVGGYDKYVKSLGGVFTKWADRNKELKPDYVSKNEYEFQEAADYVFGLMTMYGFNYSHGAKGSAKNWGYGANDAFYNNSADYDKLGLLVYENGSNTTIDQICSGKTKGGMQTNCGWSATYIFRKAGLIPEDGENVEVEFYGDKSYHKYYRNRGAKILTPKDTSDLQIGDVIGYFKSGTGFTYAHCAVVVAVDKKKGTYTLFDGGSARFIKTRGCNVTGKLGDSPLYGSYTSFKVLRMNLNLLKLDYDRDKAGTYEVTCNDFNIREGAYTDKKSLAKLPKGTLLITDGYYQTDKQGRVWLYGTAYKSGKQYTGFCCAKSYLKKV